MRTARPSENTPVAIGVRATVGTSSEPAVRLPADFEPTAPRETPWVVTGLAECDGGDSSNEDRLGCTVALVRRLLAGHSGPGVVLLPGGWLTSGGDEPHALIPVVEGRLQPLLAAAGREVAVCLGVDRGDGTVQLGVAVGPRGVVALARKFYPTADERELGHVAAAGFLDLECGSGRVFTVGGRRFYLAVCNDLFGIRHQGLDNPGVDAVLGLIHGFCPRGEGPSGDVDFARKGLAGASKQWRCPVFASAVFWGRPVPARWPSAVQWTRGEEGVKTWRYEYNPVAPVVEERAELGSTRLVVRCFSSEWSPS